MVCSLFLNSRHSNGDVTGFGMDGWDGWDGERRMELIERREMRKRKKRETEKKKHQTKLWAYDDIPPSVYTHNKAKCDVFFHSNTK